VPPTRWLEAAALLVVTVVVTVVVTQTSTHLLFLTFPVLIWAALRFQQIGAAPCNLIVSAAIVHAAAAGHGPFAGLDTLPLMITLQLFNGSATLTALLLAAITNERNEAQHAVEHAVAELTSAVRMLEPYSLLRNSVLADAVRKRDPPGDQRTGR
jgi:integral membrane sensor domain MASE1